MSKRVDGRTLVDMGDLIDLIDAELRLHLNAHADEGAEWVCECGQRLGVWQSRETRSEANRAIRLHASKRVCSVLDNEGVFGQEVAR